MHRVRTLTPPYSSPKNIAMRKTGHSGRVRAPGMRAASFLLLAAQILTLGHLLVVRHVTCPEHGDIIHAGQPALHGQHSVDEDASGRRSIEGTVPRAESVHDHCFVCTSTHERFALLPPTRQATSSFEVALPIPPPSESSPFAPVDLIVLSPKNSPPAG